MTNKTLIAVGAVALPLLLSQSQAFAATRDRGGARLHKAVVMPVARPADSAPIGVVAPRMSPAGGDMSDMWPYFLDLG